MISSSFHTLLKLLTSQGSFFYAPTDSVQVTSTFKLIFIKRLKSIYRNKKSGSHRPWTPQVCLHPFSPYNICIEWWWTVRNGGYRQVVMDYLLFSLRNLKVKSHVLISLKGDKTFRLQTDGSVFLHVNVQVIRLCYCNKNGWDIPISPLCIALNVFPMVFRQGLWILSFIIQEGSEPWRNPLLPLPYCPVLVHIYPNPEYPVAVVVVVGAYSSNSVANANIHLINYTPNISNSYIRLCTYIEVDRFQRVSESERSSLSPLHQHKIPIFGHYDQYDPKKVKHLQRDFTPDLDLSFGQKYWPLKGQKVHYNTYGTLEPIRYT